MDVFRLLPSNYLSANEIEAASLVRFGELNVQEQQKNTWPDVPVVGRAYLDQLNRTKALPAAHASAVKAALDAADKVRTGSDKNAANVKSQLASVASQVDSDAASASGRDAARMHALAATMKGIAAGMK
jgi:hypothetical protein